MPGPLPTISVESVDTALAQVEGSLFFPDGVSIDRDSVSRLEFHSPLDVQIRAVTALVCEWYRTWTALPTDDAPTALTKSSDALAGSLVTESTNLGDVLRHLPAEMEAANQEAVTALVSPGGWNCQSAEYSELPLLRP